METTGHKSTDGVCSYKRTSTQQKESVSDVLSLAKRPKLAELDVPQPQRALSYSSLPTQSVSAVESFQHMFTFNHCSDLKINIQFINKYRTLCSYTEQLTHSHTVLCYCMMLLRLLLHQQSCDSYCYVHDINLTMIWPVQLILPKDTKTSILSCKHSK